MLVIFVADSARNRGNCASKMEIQWAWNAHLDWSVGMQTNSFFIAWLTISWRIVLKRNVVRFFPVIKYLSLCLFDSI